jgi:ribose transport system substrate-binding protein
MKTAISIPGLIARLLTLVLGATVAVSCAAPSAPVKNEKPRVALVMKSLANEFFKTMEDGARAHQTAHADDYDLLTMGIKDELDVAGQIRLVEQAIAEGVDALVIAPADSKALVSVCQRAQKAGLVVVNIDNQFDATVLDERQMTVPFVGPDNAKGARRVGDYLATKLDAGAKVAILEGVPNAFNAVERKRGFVEAMDAAGIEVVASQSANWETSKANQVAAALVIEIPDLAAILCANDSMALGAVAALKAAGKSDDVKIVGYDNISAVQELLKNGRVLATADQHADQLAVFGIEYALEMLKTGKTQTPPTLTNRETSVDLVTVESLAQ